MDDTILSRVSPSELEIRSDGRTVYGVFVPFDQPATVNDGLGNYREVFRYGSLTKTLQERGQNVKLLMNHDRKRDPIGRSISLREDKIGGVGEFRVSDTANGNDALELVRDGVLDAFSIGFAPVPEKDRVSGDLTERLEVMLREISVVAFPAYAGAAIQGVRSEDQKLEARIALLEQAIRGQSTEQVITLNLNQGDPAAIGKDIVQKLRAHILGTPEQEPPANEDEPLSGALGLGQHERERFLALLDL